jgi:hypothetical protein
MKLYLSKAVLVTHAEIHLVDTHTHAATIKRTVARQITGSTEVTSNQTRNRTGKLSSEQKSLIRG